MLADRLGDQPLDLVAQHAGQDQPGAALLGQGDHGVGLVAPARPAEPQPGAVDPRAAADRQREQREQQQRRREPDRERLHRPWSEQPCAALRQPEVEIGDRPPERSGARVVDVGPRVAVHRHVAAQQHDVAGAAAAIEVAQQVGRELDVAAEHQHPVDEDARIADRDEPAGAALAGDHDRALVERDHRGRAFDPGQRRRVVGDDLSDVGGERVVAARGRDRCPQPAFVVLAGARGVDLGAQQPEALHRVLAVAEVVGDHDVAAGLDERAEPGRVDPLERVDQHEDVLGRQVAPLERAHRRHREAHPLGEPDEARHAVPRRRARIVVAALGVGRARRACPGEPGDRHGGQPAVRARRHPAGIPSGQGGSSSLRCGRPRSMALDHSISRCSSRAARRRLRSAWPSGAGSITASSA